MQRVQYEQVPAACGAVASCTAGARASVSSCPRAVRIRVLLAVRGGMHANLRCPPRSQKPFGMPHIACCRHREGSCSPIHCRSSPSPKHACLWHTLRYTLQVSCVHRYYDTACPCVPAPAPQVCVPLHAMIRRWVLEGELDDPHGEFFVVRAAGVTAAVNSAAGTAAAAPPPLDLWNSTYQLHEERLPPFIGRPLAQRILRAGKAIHYLNLACGDGGWVQQRAEALAARVEAVGLGGRPGGSMDAEVRKSTIVLTCTGLCLGCSCYPACAIALHALACICCTLADVLFRACVCSEWGVVLRVQLLALEGLVSSAVRAVDGRLLAVLWRRYRLRAHFAAIRRFLLLGQGDWVTAFIDLVGWKGRGAGEEGVTWGRVCGGQGRAGRVGAQSAQAGPTCA